MIKQIFGSRPTTKLDVYLAAGAAVIAAINFIGVKQQYTEEHTTDNKENNA